MQINPFAKIEKKELYTQDGMQSLGYSVRVEKEVDPETLTPKYLECGVVSNNYLLIPNKEVVEIANKIANTMGNGNYKWKEDKCMFNGKKFTYSLALDTDSSDLYREEVRIGEPVSLGMLWQNTYDGTSSLNFMFYINVLSCLNGQLNTKVFNRFRFKHDKTSIDWEDQIMSANNYLRHAPKQYETFLNKASVMTEQKIDKESLNYLRREWIPKIGPNSWGNIMDKYLSGKDYTRWGLMQACTHEFWHKKNLTHGHIKNNEYCVTNLMEEAN